MKINRDYPIHLHPNDPMDNECLCLLNHDNANITMRFDANVSTIDGDNGIRNKCLQMGGTLYGNGCHNAYVADVFLFSFILLTFTYILSIKLKSFTSTRFFTTNIRQMVSDFSVPIAIVIMTAVDNLTGLPTPKLQVPNDFKVCLIDLLILEEIIIQFFLCFLNFSNFFFQRESNFIHNGKR